MKNEKLTSVIKILCKVFFVGLILQFFLQTFVTYKLNLSGWIWNAIRMRKEMILLVLCGCLIYTLIAQIPSYLQEMKKESKSLTFKTFFSYFRKERLFQFVILLIGVSSLCMVIAFLLQHASIKAFVLSFKYDLLPLRILGLGMGLGYFYFTEKDQELILFYRKLIKVVLFWGLFWWMILYFIPQTLRHLGYSPYNPEGLIGQAPPAAYYTNIYPHFENSYVRNSFLFERPITFGFWLIAFFPFFFFGFLKGKKKKSQIFYCLLYGALVFSTWSRAALGVRGLEVIAVLVILNWEILKKHMIKILIGCLILGMGCCYLGKWIFARDYSNTGHIILIVEGRKLAKEKLFSWRWIWYSGPASHQLCYRETEEPDMNPLEMTFSEIHPDPRCETIRNINNQYDIKTFGYNPENQYLQILMEYGILWLIAWGLCFVWILWYAFRTWKKYHMYSMNKKQEVLYLSIIGLGLGLLWLCAEGVVLHSLVDRMVVYPFFLLYGVIMGMREKERTHLVFVPQKEKEYKKKKKA